MAALGSYLASLPGGIQAQTQPQGHAPCTTPHGIGAEARTSPGVIAGAGACTSPHIAGAEARTNPHIVRADALHDGGNDAEYASVGPTSDAGVGDTSQQGGESESLEVENSSGELGDGLHMGSWQRRLHSAMRQKELQQVRSSRQFMTWIEAQTRFCQQGLSLPSVGPAVQ